MDQERELKFFEKRRLICDECEHKTQIMGINTCEACGCSIWGKNLIKPAKCPKGKWNAE